VQLQDILRRVARGLEYIDLNTTIRRHRRRSPTALYHRGLPALYEDDTRKELVSWWETQHPGDFQPGTGITVRHPYPNIPRSECDLVFNSNTFSGPGQGPEWAVELKVIRFIGDNGGKNSYGAGKFLSPYRMETSLTTDIVRLHNSTIAPKKAVVGYAFQHSFRTCDDALQHHPHEGQRIARMRAVCASNDPHAGVIDARDMLRLVDFSVKFHGVVTHVQTEPFVAWGSPTGGEGLVFGWEV